MSICYKKRFLSLYICITFLTVSFFNFYKTQEVYADTLALSAIGSGISLSGAGGAIASALSVSALPALVIVGGAVTAGVIYKNRHHIRDFAIGAMDYLTSVGQGVGKGVIDLGNGVVKMTGSAKTALLDYVGQVKRGRLPAVEIPLVNSINVPAGKTVSTNIVIPFSKDLNVQMIPLRTGDKHISNVRFKYRIEGYPNVSLEGDGRVTYDYEYGKLWCGSDSVKLPTYGNICVDLENGGSFDTSVGVIQSIPRDSSICANVGSVTGVPAFNDDYFSMPSDTYVTPSNTATWDKVIGIDGAIPSTVGTVSDSIPNIENPSIENPSLELPTDVKLDFSPLEVNFKDRFPFSIPFDIYNVFKTFSNSERIPPVFNVKFDKGLVGKAEFDIDFKKFDLVASILRYFLLAMFLVGLMKITRFLISG